MLLVVATVCGYVLIALPRTAIPDELPALRYSQAAADAVRVEDRKLAKRAPSSPAALEVDALLHEKGESERQATEMMSVQKARAARIRQALAALYASDGAEAAVLLRARAVEQMQAALDLTLPPEQIQGVLGNFATTLQETACTRDGVLVAPWLVVRTLYKVRWNVIMSQPLLYALSPVERLAYNGWFALHVPNGPLDARLNVLHEYQKLGGHSVFEALGVLAYSAGNPTGAIGYLERAQTKRSSWRLANYERAARRAKYTMETLPALR